MKIDLKFLIITGLFFSFIEKDSSASFSTSNTLPPIIEMTQPSAPITPKSVMIMIHGLNNKAAIMNSLVKTFSEKGSIVLNLTLQGHDGNLENFKKVTLKTWEDELIYTLNEAGALAQKNNLPIYFLGYSTGAALFIDLLSKNLLPVAVKKMGLLAPAITLKYTYALKFIKALGATTEVMPARTPKIFRANEGTPFNGYMALMEMADTAQKANPAVLDQIPAEIFIDSKDELVNSKDLNEFIKSKSLSHWKLNFLREDEASSKKPNQFGYHHLIFDEQTLGPQEWKRVNDTLSQLFELF